MLCIAPRGKKAGECTPKKRPRYFGHSPCGSPQTPKKSFSKFKLEAEETDIDQLISEDDKVIKLVMKYGISAVVQMKGVLDTIPTNFPNRMDLTFQITSQIDRLECLEKSELLTILKAIDALPVPGSSVTELLWRASEKLDKPLTFYLVPRVTNCIVEGCSGKLYGRKEEVTEVTVFTMSGPIPGLKATLACCMCGSRYGIDRYRVRGGDSYFYPKEYKRTVVEASNKVYFSEDLYEFLCESGNHGFVSAQAFSQIYQSVFHAQHPLVKKFQMLSNKDVTASHNGHTHADTEASGEHDYQYLTDDSQKQAADNGDIRLGLNPFMSRKNCSEVFLNGELEKEIQQRRMEHFIAMKGESCREGVMKKIDEMRRTELYPHPSEDCNEICQQRGCQNLRVIDSCWKLCIPHCMLAVPTVVEQSKLLTFPNVCTEEPKAGSVFCEKHHELLLQHKIPTDKKEFLAHIGCKENPQTQEDIKRVDQQVLAFMSSLEKKNSSALCIGTSAVQYQGTQRIVDKMSKNILNEAEPNSCNKDTGEKGRLRQRARGHFAAVTGGGNILCFNPIYKSESPSQIFMLTVQMIYNEMKDVPEDQQEDRLKNYILSYDNMCNLDKLKAAGEDLPLPGHLSKTWKLIRKIIDRLHLKNHKDKQCQMQYNPDKVLQKDEQKVNTMAAEQLFAWMSRFKKIVNSMTQTHHLFYLHRMCQRRNRYSALCRKRGVEPVHPGVNTKFIS